MKINDFSLPRRMSKSAFIIIWAQTLMTILKLIVIFGIISIINKEGVDMKDAFVKVLLISIGIIAYSAIYAAIDIYRNRERYADMTHNPLRKQYFDKSKDNVVLDLTSDDKDTNY